jgi:hypothetical protein
MAVAATGFLLSLMVAFGLSHAQKPEIPAAQPAPGRRAVAAQPVAPVVAIEKDDAIPVAVSRPALSVPAPTPVLPLIAESPSSRYRSQSSVREDAPVTTYQPDDRSRTGSSSYTPSDAGRTPTGLQKYVGPRGGVFHYSKNGNKVYHSRKK